jgi:hypothetical protein
VLWELNSRIERTDQAVFDDTGHGHGAPMASSEISLYGRRRRVGGHLKRRHLRLGGNLFVL